MIWHRHLSWHGLRTHGTLLAPLAVAAALVLASTSAASSDGASLKGLVQGTATALLLAAVILLVQNGRIWRQFRRHASIRADIAAAGGLGKRLMV